MFLDQDFVLQPHLICQYAYNRLLRDSVYYHSTSFHGFFIKSFQVTSQANSNKII